MVKVHDGETAARARTRKAVVDAAVGELARDPAASLGQIADAAGVGRTTLHRYFPERADLLAAVAVETSERLAAAQACARLDEGTGGEGLQRLCQEYLLLGDLLTLIFTGIVPDSALETEEAEGGDPLVALVERGRADGSIDPELSAHWVVGTLWSQLYLAWEILRGEHQSRHDVVRQLMRTVGRAVAP
jgi:TetR/AcrR family transcriptional regulator, repressor for lfrA